MKPKRNTDHETEVKVVKKIKTTHILYQQFSTKNPNKVKLGKKPKKSPAI